MKDLIPNGTGNSRYLKSSLASGTTWDTALAQLRAGTFPVDFNGINSAGVAQQGTALNKANLLSDSTASALGLSGDPTVNDALAATQKKLTFDSTPTSGSSNPVTSNGIYEALLQANAGNFFGVDVSTTLNSNSWATISAVARAGKGADYWSVGDCKQTHIQGTVGTLSVNTDLCVYIIGFNHYGSTGIDFGTFKTALTGGVNVCLVDSKYNSTSTTGEKYFNMNHWGGSSDPYNTNYGGWKGCDLRYDILGSTNLAPSGYGAVPTTSRVGYDATTTTATSPVANTLMAALPSDLRSVMRPMTVYTDNTGNKSNTDAKVTTSVDYLPLLAEFEIFGSNTYANPYEKDHQAQYAYYSAGNSKVKYQHSATASIADWHDRSPNRNSAGGFCAVSTGVGSASYAGARYSHGLSPIFRV